MSKKRKRKRRQSSGSVILKSETGKRESEWDLGQGEKRGTGPRRGALGGSPTANVSSQDYRPYLEQ